MSNVSPEAQAAMIDLYHSLALAKARKGTEYVDPSDVANLDDRPRTEEEAQALAAEQTAEFKRILDARNVDDMFTVDLNLGCDQIFNQFKA